MEENDIIKGFTKGLRAGYAGDGQISKILRGSFSGVSSNFNDSEISYIDEWFVESEMGGGQELLSTKKGKYTRLYAGGTIPNQDLKKLNITTEEVFAFLKESLLTLGEKTRWENNCEIQKNDWRYEYRIVFTNTSIPIIVAIESIYFKSECVHIHPFIISPIK